MNPDRLTSFLEAHDLLYVAVEGYPDFVELRQDDTTINSNGEVSVDLNDGGTVFMTERVSGILWTNRELSDITFETIQ